MHRRLPPLLVTFVLAILMWGAARVWPRLSFDLPAAHMLAATIALAGVAVCALGVASFRRSQTTVDPRRPAKASALVASGVYRLSRNPMYLGFLLLLVAWGVYLSHVPSLLLVPPAMALYLNRFQIPLEEQALESRFGDEYRAYKQQVRRWL